MAMATEPEIRTAMVRLLAPVSPSWVAEQVGVTRQQVDRWKNGRYVTLRRLHQVAEAVRSLLPEHAEAAPLGGTPMRRLLIGVMALEARNGITPDDLDVAELAMGVDARLASTLAPPQRKLGGQARGQAGGQTGGSPSSKQRKP